MAGEVPAPTAIDYPMTAGHLEIEAMKNGVEDVWIAISHLKHTLNHLHNFNTIRFTDDYETTLRYNLDFIYQNIARIPARMTAVVLERKNQLDAFKKDQLAVEEKLAAAVARERELVADAEAFEKTKEMANNKMIEAIKLLRAVKTREKFIERRAANRKMEQVPEGLLDMQANAEVGNEAEAAIAAAEGETGRSGGFTSSTKIPLPPLKNETYGRRDRRPVESTEKLPVEEFNLGADAAAEDAAEAADAVTRMDWLMECLTIGSKTKTTIMERDMPPSDPEMTSNISSDVELMQSWRDGTAAREERLWDREVIVSSREKQLSDRLSTCVAREKKLEHTKKHMKTKQIQQITFEKERIDKWFRKLLEEGVDWMEERLCVMRVIIDMTNVISELESMETKIRNEGVGVGS